MAAMPGTLLGRGVASRQPFSGGLPLPSGCVDRSTASRRRKQHRQAAAASVIRELHSQLSSRQVSVAEVTAEYLRRLHAAEPTVQSFITVTEEHAIEQAKQLDAQIAASNSSGFGLLTGIPIAIKDNICTDGVATTAGSRCLEGYRPAYDATTAARLKAAGAVLVGKTNMDEFGMGSSTENSAYHVTRNPWDSDRVPGGSSGGSAAAVAAGQCVAALGSDTGGSIRQPAHFCGVVGLKPTYGRVSRYGLVSYASSLDVVGPLAHTVEDAAILLNAIAGHDPRDATSSQASAVDFTSHIVPRDQLGDSPLKGRRIGLIDETLGEGVDPGVASVVEAAAAKLESLGAVVERVSLPSFGLGLPSYYVIALSEASSNLSRYDGVRYGLRLPEPELRTMYNKTRGSGLGQEVKRRILMGTYALSAGYYDAYYKRAQQVRTLVQRELASALSTCDALLCPAAPSPAYRLGEKSSDPLAMYKGDLMTVNVNLAGLPAVCLPAGKVPAAAAAGGGGGGGPGSEGGGGETTGGKELPVGVQLLGRPFGEAELLGIAAALEAALEFEGLRKGL